GIRATTERTARLVDGAGAGLEPARAKSPGDFKSPLSTYSNTPARGFSKLLPARSPPSALGLLVSPKIRLALIAFFQEPGKLVFKTCLRTGTAARPWPVRWAGLLDA